MVPLDSRRIVVVLVAALLLRPLSSLIEWEVVLFVLESVAAVVVQIVQSVAVIAVIVVAVVVMVLVLLWGELLLL
jgi:hypothetical protein